MALPTIRIDASLDFLGDENAFSLGALQQDELAVPFTPQFAAFQTSLLGVTTTRLELVSNIAMADGAVRGVDARLDRLVNTIDRTLLIAVGNDRDAPMYALYFGKKTASVLTSPILGDELATVRLWEPSLQTSPNPAVAALAPQLATVVAAADAAVAQRAAARQALAAFDAVGAKKALIDSYNALRKTVYGQLGALRGQNSQANLPTNFADLFFRHSQDTGVTTLTNPNDVQTRIDSIQQDLTAAQNHLAQLKTAATDAAAAKLAEQDLATQVEAARKAEAAAAQQRKDLEKQLAAQKKNAKKK